MADCYWITFLVVLFCLVGAFDASAGDADPLYSLCLSSVEGLNHEDAITVRFPYHSGRITVGVSERFPFQFSNIDLGESFSVLF